MYLNTVFKYNVFKYCPALDTQTDQPITVWISLREVRVCDFSLLYSKILCGESRE